MAAGATANGKEADRACLFDVSGLRAKATGDALPMRRECPKQFSANVSPRTHHNHATSVLSIPLTIARAALQ